MPSRTAYISNASTTAQDVVLNVPGMGISVVNLDGAGIVSFRVDGVTATNTDDNFFVPQNAGSFKSIHIQKWPCTVSVWASVTTKVCIEVVDE